ncbi:MAG: hypothetical protein ABI423_04115 [Burkholderiales bacterium]
MLLAAALLVAQQAALEHALWHAGAAQRASSEAQKSAPAGSPLCDQHAALGAVAGAIGCAPVATALAESGYAAFAALEIATRVSAPLAPSSRDPPALL